MSSQMESAGLGALSQTPKDVAEQLLALAQELKSFLPTSSTTVTISSSNESTSNPNSPTFEIPQYDDSAQYVPSQGNIGEQKALLQTLKVGIERGLTLIQGIRSEVELMQTFVKTLKTREKSPSGVIRAFEDVMVSEFSLIKALKDGGELQLAWVQTFKNAAVDSSLLMIPTSEGMVMQTAPVPLVEKMVGLSSLPSIQELKDSIKPLQTSVQAPKDSMKPTEISAQASEALMVESRDLIQRFKVTTMLQVYSNQLLKYEIDTQLFSVRCFQCANTMELGSFQILEDAMEKQSRWIRPLLDTTEM